MARPLRVDIRDGTYHVTSRGLERRAIVQDDADRAKWLELLDRVAARRRWRVFAWALMTNHFHLFLQTPEADLSAGMHDLNSGYASAYNRRHLRAGPLLQGRFKAILVERAAHAWELSRYVHLNPVRAGLVGDPAAYPWSSCRHYVRGGDSPAWLAWDEVLGEHGRALPDAREAYARFLAEGLAHPPPSPLRTATASSFLGSEGFIQRMRALLEGRLADREVPAARQVRALVPVERIEAAVCQLLGVQADSLRARRRRHNQARALALHLCHELTGTPMVELGRRFGGISGQAAGIAARQAARRVAQDRHWADLAERGRVLALAGEPFGKG